jgi:exodeoxyribonuclease VII large subunit
MQEKIRNKRQRVELAAERLAGLSPVARLEGGYSVTSKSGRVVKSIAQVSEGDDITVDVTDGIISARVQGMQKRQA